MIAPKIEAKLDRRQCKVLKLQVEKAGILSKVEIDDLMKALCGDFQENGKEVQ